MKVEIMFWYSGSGKYHSSCEVDIPEEKLGSPGSHEAIQSIVDYQNVLIDGWNNHVNFFVTTRELEDGRWWTHLYKPERFLGVMKTYQSPSIKDGVYCCSCGKTHSRGPVNGVDVYRCLSCGATHQVKSTPSEVSIEV